MPSTRSQAGVDTPAGEAAEVAEALEEAAAELSAEIAARNQLETLLASFYIPCRIALPSRRMSISCTLFRARGARARARAAASSTHPSRRRHRREQAGNSTL